ncbi:MAG: hypothetical protein J6B85_12565 [Lachnospiraceae bacterium]|nr:hypothetical protein [Lachnospiraceae bacterium]
MFSTHGISFLRRFRLPIIILLTLVLAAGTVGIAERRIESIAYVSPEYDRINLLPILVKKSYSEEDYKTLYLQTGLGQPAIDDIRRETDTEEYPERILSFQDNFFASADYVCEHRLIFTSQEFLIDEEGDYRNGFELAPLKDGDILITLSSHTFGWRNGHAGIVTNAKTGQTLEAITIGVSSAFQQAKDWLGSPTLIVLRLKEEVNAGHASIASQAAQLAKDLLIDVPYSLTVGLISPKYPNSGELSGTHCAHLVWLAYRAFGVDLDSDGGRLVTVKDIANSPLLEVVQVYGVNPEDIWP